MRERTDGKVYRTEGEWRQLLQRQEKSGIKAVEFCQREGVVPGSFNKWCRLLGSKAMRAVEQAGFVELTGRSTCANHLILSS